MSTLWLAFNLPYRYSCIHIARYARLCIFEQFSLSGQMIRQWRKWNDDYNRVIKQNKSNDARRPILEPFRISARQTPFNLFMFRSILALVMITVLLVFLSKLYMLSKSVLAFAIFITVVVVVFVSFDWVCLMHRAVSFFLRVNEKHSHPVSSLWNSMETHIFVVYSASERRVWRCLDSKYYLFDSKSVRTIYETKTF